MTVHLIKLCVGVDSLQDLKDWQTERLKSLRKGGQTPELCHRTSQTPRRRDEVLDGGSLYWVIKGFILVRQRVLDLRPDRKDDGRACCGLSSIRSLWPRARKAGAPFKDGAISMRPMPRRTWLRSRRQERRRPRPWLRICASFA